MRRIFLLLGIVFLAACNSNFQKISTEGKNKTISGTIKVAPKFVNQVKTGSVLFVIARQGDGPPLAVQKISVTKFPMTFELSENDMMMPGMKFEGDVVIIARIDKDGNAGPPQPGDLEGRTKKMIHVGDQSVEVLIDKLFSK